MNFSQFTLMVTRNIL